jgi:D-psicose/D-tagatose/L-ribulose 3-epimerase
VRIALCNEVLSDLDIEHQCALAATLGYDGLELEPFTFGEEPHLLSQSRRATIRQAAADSGIAITSLHWLLVRPKGLSITSADGGVRAQTLDVMERLVELAVDLGCTAMVHGSPDQRTLPAGGDAHAARERALEAFTVVGEHARRAGLVYCIEPLAPDETNFINSVAEAAEIVRAIDNPALRTMIDCNAASRSEGEGLPQLIDHWLPTGLVAHIQVNDSNGRGPGQGLVPFAPVFAALLRNRYRGTVAVEPFEYVPDGPTVAARAIGYIRGILETLEHDRAGA